jgi:hypothetical protein
VDDLGAAGCTGLNCFEAAAIVVAFANLPV